MRTRRFVILKPLAAVALMLTLAVSMSGAAVAETLCANEPLLGIVDSNGDGIASAGEIRAVAPGNAELQAAASQLEAKGYSGIQYNGCSGDAGNGSSSGAGNGQGSTNGAGNSGNGSGSGNAGGGNNAGSGNASGGNGAGNGSATTSGGTSSGNAGGGQTSASGANGPAGTASGAGSSGDAVAGDGTGIVGAAGLTSTASTKHLPPVGVGTMADAVASTQVATLMVISVLALLGWALVRERRVA